MIIDWTAAPEGTTHATIPNGDPRWYKLEGGKVFCWGLTAKEWMPSFFLTVDEIADSGLRLYANGEKSLLVTITEQREMLMEALKFAKHALEECYDVREWPANGDSTCDHAIRAAEKAIAFVEGTK
ncbi:MAG: hypothetical protein ACRCXB_18715 [Aeromonadaceae bacterium]